MYLCGENKDADQLCDYCAADLYLYFHICKKVGFLMTRLNFNSLTCVEQTTQCLLKAGACLIQVQLYPFYASEPKYWPLNTDCLLNEGGHCNHLHKSFFQIDNNYDYLNGGMVGEGV